LVRRHLPPPPARIIDVGGGAGVHARWLAGAGYSVHLVDPVPLHVEQAEQASAAQPQAPFTAAIGDARDLAEHDESVDAVLLLGPLYHLTARGDRLAALREARRVVRPGGKVFAAAISQFASLMDGLLSGFGVHPEFQAIIERDLEDGQHRNPTGRQGWFTTAFFHHPDELETEVRSAGLELVELVGVEGPGGMVRDIEERWRDDGWREFILFAARAVESEPSLLGASFHLLAIARR
jgi:ubiquinone/menaquinone biosynthesis C-methylase UbiE